ncbi:MAG: hypothetical protein II835_13560 [Fibrobacter sp.]|nr:hypothetical protein [Fibrobacter sp.]
MKKAFITILTMAMLTSVGFAKPSLVVNGKAKKFLTERNHFDAKNFNKKGMKAPARASSLVVAIDESSDKTQKNLKNRLSENYRVRVSAHEKNVLWFNEGNVTVDLSDLESDRNLSANKILSAVLPSEYADQFKLVTIDKRYLASMDKKVEIDGYAFKFKRVFNGRVVRNDKNFLTVLTDKYGHVQNANIAMQDLKTTSEILTTNDDAAENQATLDSVLVADYDRIEVFNEDGEQKQLKAEKVEVGSVAEAYCEVEDGSAKKLYPCLSYVSKVSVGDGKFISRIIDAPHSRHSWNRNRQGKKPVKFHRYNR